MDSHFYVKISSLFSDRYFHLPLPHPLSREFVGMTCSGTRAQFTIIFENCRNLPRSLRKRDPLNWGVDFPKKQEPRCGRRIGTECSERGHGV
ncbi:MAG: hypothetical protein ACP5LD_03395 [Desulfomonilaceae bacterium]